MITTCPECTTTFRITEEQLGVRAGKVRCGKCTAIFDANQRLRTDDTLAEDALAASESVPVDMPLEFPPLHAVESVDAVAGPSTNGSVFSPQDHAQPKLVAEPPLASAPKQEISTIDEREFAANGPARTRMAGWGVASGLLGLILIGQIGFHFRGELALFFPVLRPVVTELCSTLNCTLPLPKRAELVSIESSDLQADPASPGVMILTATLRNRAGFPQSLPSLELTLTDTQDQPLARRVLGVPDYAGRDANMETAFAGNSELPVKVFLEASSLKATGYRLYLFYP